MHADSKNRTPAPAGNSPLGVDVPATSNRSGLKVQASRKYLFSDTSVSNKEAGKSSTTNKKVRTSEVGNQGVFSAHSFSPEFESAYKKLQRALNSQENRLHETQLGWLSPGAEEALRDLAVVVENKGSQKQASAASRLAFGITPLNPDEENAWDGLVRQLPAVYKAYLPVCSPWRDVTHADVHAALSEDTAMASMLTKPEGQIFLAGLVDAINSKRKDMAPTDNGMAITLRFPDCYGTTAHIALAGAWYDENNRLKISLCHQESIIFAQPDKPAIGVVFNRFDTSKEYPGHYAPVVESIKLSGPPSANVFPCPHPEAIVGATQEISGLENKRLYGPTYTWNEKQLVERLKKLKKTPEEIDAEIQKQKSEFGGKHPETCFNVTHKVLAEMYYAQPAEQALLPHLVRKTSGFSSGNRTEFDAIQSRSGKSINLNDVPTLPFAEQVGVFLDVGKKWGMSVPWDVPSQNSSKILTPAKRPGPLAWEFPTGARGVKFNGSTAGLTLNGKPVRPAVTYSIAEAQQMVFEGKTDPAKLETFLAVTSVPVRPTSNTGAKL